VTRPQEVVPKPALRGERSNLEEPIVSEFGVKSLKPANPLITDLLEPILVQVFPPRVTYHERQIVFQVVMEENYATSSGSPHTSSMVATIPGVLPPNPPSLVWNIAPFTQSVVGPPFSYGMSGFDTNFVLT
jgi:hypothetical protein